VLQPFASTVHPTPPQSCQVHMGNNPTSACTCYEQEPEARQQSFQHAQTNEHLEEEVADFATRDSSWVGRANAGNEKPSKGSQRDPPPWLSSPPESPRDSEFRISVVEAVMNSSVQQFDKIKQQELCHLEFDVKQDTHFGLQLTENAEPHGDSQLIVDEIQPKSMFSRTKDGHPGVAAGDTVVEVNGESGSASYLHDLLQQAFQQASLSDRSAISLSVRARLASFDVVLDRVGPDWQKLGVGVAIDKNKSDRLIVTGVRSEGLVPQWNVDHSSRRICKGDHITQVNDITRDAHSMCMAVQQAEEGATLTFHVVAPPNPRMPRVSQLWLMPAASRREKKDMKMIFHEDTSTTASDSSGGSNKLYL